MDEAFGRFEIAMVGDPADEVFVSLVSAIPQRVDCYKSVAELAESRTEAEQRLDCIVLHLPFPSQADFKAILDVAPREAFRPRVILCTSPLARYRQLELWAGACHAILSDTTAGEVIWRYVGGRGHSRVSVEGPQSFARRRRRVAVVSSDFELRVMIADICQRAGYAACPVASWNEATAGSLAVWDVPVLDESWRTILRRESHRRRILALAGFCDRALVRQLKQHGALACLDLPTQTDDIAWVLDRLCHIETPSRTAHDRHNLPGPPNLSGRASDVRFRPRGVDSAVALE